MAKQTTAKERTKLPANDYPIHAGLMPVPATVAVAAESRDDFYCGYCAALAAALYGDDGTSTGYLEAVGCVDERALLDYAERHHDGQLANIRRAIRALRQRRTARV